MASNPTESSQKRPMNAFLIFCKRHRSVVKQKYPHLENRSITKILGEWWAALDGDQKQKYTELARQYKEAFMKANPHFKWYRTDNFASAPAMQPPSPPQSEPPVPTEVVVKTAQIVQGDSTGQSGTGSSNPQINSAPKPLPPKKRYLENGEFKAMGAPSTSGHSSSTATAPVISVAPAPPPPPPPTPATAASAVLPKEKTPAPIGPPVLDIETMNRVIVDALAAGPNPAPSTYMNLGKNSKSASSSNNNGIVTSNGSGSGNGVSGVIGGNKGEKVTLEIQNHKRSVVGGRGSPERQQHQGTNNNASNHQVEITTPTSTADGTSNIMKQRLNSFSAADNVKKPSSDRFEITAESLREAESQSSLVKPPPTASKVNAMVATASLVAVPTSSAIPQSTSTTPDDKPLNLSASKILQASNQQIIDHFIDKLLNTGGECGEGNPMPVEMLQTSSSNCIPQQNNSMSPISAKELLKNQQRKDRSCKGKRYQEMINENKISKRVKSNSVSAGSTSGEAEAGGRANSIGGSTSKWVSGGFDLEEHIAALPQLGDAHLMNALSHTKMSKSGALNGVKSSSASGHRNESDGDSHDGLTTHTSVAVEDNAATGMNLVPNANVNTLIHTPATTAPAAGASEAPQTSEQPARNGRLLFHGEDSTQAANRQVQETDVQKNVNEWRPNEMEVGPCDGLAALAEVALSQAQQCQASGVPTTTSSGLL